MLVTVVQVRSAHGAGRLRRVQVLNQLAKHPQRLSQRGVHVLAIDLLCRLHDAAQHRAAPEGSQKRAVVIHRGVPEAALLRS